MVSCIFRGHLRKVIGGFKPVLRSGWTLTHLPRGQLGDEDQYMPVYRYLLLLSVDFWFDALCLSIGYHLWSWDDRHVFSLSADSLLLTLEALYRDGF